MAIGLVTALAGGLRFYHLSAPHSYVFDEVYYAKDGCFDAGLPYRKCHLDSPQEQTSGVHPPLGRWIIAGGIAAFGNRSFGWRFASAVAGTLSVLFLSVMAARMFRSALWGGVAGLLLATENLNFVQSRMAMLDIFVTVFVVAGFMCLVLDRDWIYRRTPAPQEIEEEDESALLAMPPDRPPSPIFRPWRIAAGLAFGAAAASKWSGGLALIAAIPLSFMWEWSRRKRIGLPDPLRQTLMAESWGIILFIGLLPVAVYMASYARYWTGHGFHDWIHLQRGMASFSLQLRATHPYASKPWSWILLKRPVAYYYQCTRMSGSTCLSTAEILGLGNPLIFWGSVITIPYAFLAWIWKRDARGGLITLAFAALYLPWLLTRRTSFLFYMAPITPFMVLAGVFALRDMSEARIGIERSRAFAPLAGFAVLAAVGLFFFFFPVLTGRGISQQAWVSRMWFGRCVPKPTWCWI